jgi:predicted O-linked N-acetylglucosamine transferase (SPINDLY family)
MATGDHGVNATNVAPPSEVLMRAVALHQAGMLEEAEITYRALLDKNPNDSHAWHYLGLIALQKERYSDAVNLIGRAIKLNRTIPAFHCNLGNAYKNLGQFDSAAAAFFEAVRLDPQFLAAHYNLGNTLLEQNKPEAATDSYRKTLLLKPDFAEAYSNMGNALRNQGYLLEARECYRKAYALGFNGARVRDAFMLPAIMGTRLEMLASRAEFERSLDQLILEKVTVDDPLKSVGETNFFLAYHGLNDRDLQVKVAKFYERACPSLLYTAPHCNKPRSGTLGKIRIGFLSMFFYSHSVSLCFSKVIEALSLKSQFEIFLISNRPIDKKIYSGFSGGCVTLPNNLEQARQILASLELDFLVYLDIGMEPLSYFLAYSRLARAQCVWGGHPVTTGISNMDYFLSTSLTEPPGADAHYSEKLVCFPRPLSSFARPLPPAKLKTRQELGLPEGRHIYMCPMKLQKIHPDFDAAMARILQLDEDGVIVLFEDGIFPFWKKSLSKRFEQTIPAEVRARIIFLPWIKDSGVFFSAIAAADIILDPFHFGIGSTLSVAFATGTPFVTKAGEFMRGRVGMGYCKMMGLTECVAADTESYSREAVAIATDQSVREKFSAKILENNSVFYGNLQPAEYLADFFCVHADSNE